ncbi:hypothetical protein A2U01_0005723, partial [Trifolium medium]|nr:hypothetical protein [Trifolium medium]
PPCPDKSDVKPLFLKSSSATEPEESDGKLQSPKSSVRDTRGISTCGT